MRKQTDLVKVKQTALALLSTEINETPYSPMIVKHPFADTGVSAIPDGKGGVEMIDLTEDDAQLRWRQSMARQIDMVIKLKANQADLLGTLIRQIEAMQDRTSRNQERIRQIDKEIADLGAKNLVITRLHTSGVLDAADYAKQTSEIGNRITDLRIERRKKLTEDEDDILLDTLKELNGILEEYEPTAEFDNDLFEQIVQDITVNDNTQITFRLLGDIQLTEKINEKGRCKSA